MNNNYENNRSESAGSSRGENHGSGKRERHSVRTSRDGSYSSNRYSNNSSGRNSYGERSSNGGGRSYSNSNDRREYNSYGSQDQGGRPQRSSYSNERSYGSNQEANGGGERRSNTQYRGDSSRRSNYGERSNNYGERNNSYGERNSERSNYGDRNNNYGERNNNRLGERKSYNNFNKKFTKGNYDPNAKYSQKKQVEYKKQFVDYSVPMRLNKFLANSGMCSRREADEYIQAGVVTVNGEVVTELGTKLVPDTDQVHFHDQLVRAEKKVYILLNKPKNCVTTVEDTHERMTVLDIVKTACSERVYPVGRLDRNTTGVLLITNDGDLTSKLTHPKYNKKKIYQVTLDKPLAIEDMEQVMQGIALEDGTIKADEISYVNDEDLSVIGIEIHSGRNRIVRRIFDYLGYHVLKLDRVYFAGLTKKNLPRGKWRHLSEMEVNMLKMSASAMKEEI